MSNNWKYQKGNPSIPLQNEKFTKNPVRETDKININNIPSEYQKVDSFEQPKWFVVIFLGGEKTERDYFNLIENNESSFPNIKIKFHPEDKFDSKTDDIKINPRIFNFAINKTKEYKEGASTLSPDKYFLITDVDHFKEAIIFYRNSCEQENINLIISNPCFEVWLYYSAHSDRFEKFNIPKKGLSNAVKKFVYPSVDGGLNCKKAILNIKQNIENSKKNYEEENYFPTIFSTQMFRLAEEMLPFIKNELELLKQKQSNIKRYR